MATKMTAKQFDALVEVYLKWQTITKHPIMPADGVEIVPEEEFGNNYYGIWVGTTHNDNPGSLYLGIEPDGYTHS